MRTLPVSYRGELSSLPIDRIERESLYGSVTTVHLDALDRPCSRACVTRNGAILRQGDTVRTYADATGRQYDREELMALDADGRPATRFDSSFDRVTELCETHATAVLDIVDGRVYAVETVAVGPLLARALGEGVVLTMRYVSRAGYRWRQGYLFAAPDGVFFVTGTPATTAEVADADDHLLTVGTQDGRYTAVRYASAASIPEPRVGLPGIEIRGTQLVVGTQETSREALEARHGDLAATMINGDPEFDLETIGTELESAEVVWLDGDGAPVHSRPRVEDRYVDADGTPLGRHEHRQTETRRFVLGQRVALAALARTAVVARSVLLQAEDGLGQHYLSELARELEANGEAALIDGGAIVTHKGGKEYVAFARGANGRLVILLSEQQVRMQGSFKNRRA